METASWGMLLLACVVAVLVIGVPGALVGLALRLRGLWLVATAPVLGTSSIALTSLWSSPLGMRWSWEPVAITAAALAAAAFALVVVVRTAKEPQRETTGWYLAPPIAVGIGVVLLSFRCVTAIGRPDWFAQAGDNVFHLNLVQWILDDGDASPLDVMRDYGMLKTQFYPDAWHATVALLCQLTGLPITVTSNAVLLVATCAIWPLGGVLLTRTFFGTSTPILIAGGAISAGFGTFPFLLIPYMGTYPLVFAITLVPASLAACAAALGVTRGRLAWVSAVAVAVLTVPGVALAHPSGVSMLCVMALPVVFGALWRMGRARRERRSLAVLLSALATVVVLAFIVAVRPNIEQPDSTRSSTAQALGEVATGGFAGTDIPLIISVLMVIGVVVSLRHGGVIGWSAVGVWAAASVIYVAAASHDEFFRIVLSDPWYADATRVAAFTPVAILPLAARGAEWAWGWARTHYFADSRPVRMRIATVTAVGLLAALMLQSSAAQGATRFMRTMFTPTSNVLTSPLPVSTDDRALLARIPSIVPKDAVIAGDPWTGASFVYGLTGRRALVPHMLAPITGKTKVFLDGISTSAADGPACRAARGLGVGWVLELHGGDTLPNRPHYNGLKDLSSSPNLTLAARVGDSSLYKITGCALG